MKRQTCTMSGQKSQERNPEEEHPTRSQRRLTMPRVFRDICAVWAPDAHSRSAQLTQLYSPFESVLQHLEFTFEQPEAATQLQELMHG